MLGLVAVQSAVQAQGVLGKVAAGGTLVIAQRESSVPFSYVSSDKKPQGYAVDLCLKIADAVRRKTGAKNMPVEMLLVTTVTRIPTIEQGKADLECGSTTNNAERRKKVAFTIPHFITGARLLVRADSKIERLENLEGKNLVSTKETTPLKVAQQANRERLLHMNILEAPDHAKAVEMVEKGGVE